MTDAKHRAMVHRTGAKPRTSYWAAIGPWRDNADAAKKDADAHRLETNPVARIRICTISFEEYTGS
jgi:hypothetical protein